MSSAELLVRVPVWLALAGYFCGAFLALRAQRQPRLLHVARVLWTIGCVDYCLHVLAAFHFVHGWNHQAAWEEVARQSQAVLGRPWGAGLWFNYVFTAVWVLDVLWWWAWPTAHAHRSRWISGPLQAFLFFMVFQGSVVFAPESVRWPSLAACTVLVWSWAKGRCSVLVF